MTKLWLKDHIERKISNTSVVLTTQELFKLAFHTDMVEDVIKEMENTGKFRLALRSTSTYDDTREILTFEVL